MKKWNYIVLATALFSSIPPAMAWEWPDVWTWISSYSSTTEEDNIHDLQGWSEENNQKNSDTEDYQTTLEDNLLPLNQNIPSITEKPETLKQDEATAHRLSKDQFFPDNTAVLFKNFIRFFENNQIHLAWRYWGDIYQRYPEIGLTIFDNPKLIDPKISDEAVHTIRHGILMYADAEIVSHALRQIVHSVDDDELYHWGRFKISHKLLNNGKAYFPIALVHKNLLPTIYLSYLVGGDDVSDDHLKERLKRILTILKYFSSEEAAKVLVLDPSYSHFKLGLKNSYCFGKIKTKGLCDIKYDFSLQLNAMIGFVYFFGAEEDSKCKAIASAILKRLIDISSDEDLTIIRSVLSASTLSSMNIQISNDCLNKLYPDYNFNQLLKEYQPGSALPSPEDKIINNNDDDHYSKETEDILS